MMTVVCNSTPLIALSRIGRFELLKTYFDDLCVPQAVYDEVVTRGGNLYGADEVRSAGWIEVKEVENKLAVDSLCLMLDRGEAEAIVLGKEQNAALLIIDDGDGRRTARSLGLKITGTIGLLLLAAEDNNLDLKRTIDDLMAVGFRLGEKEYRKIVGETDLNHDR